MMRKNIILDMRMHSKTFWYTQPQSAEHGGYQSTSRRADDPVEIVTWKHVANITINCSEEGFGYLLKCKLVKGA